MSKLSNIIQEELLNFLNEATLVKDNNLNFAQTVDADFYNFESFTTEYDTGIDRAPINIYWGIQFLANDNGVQEFKINIDKVDGIYNMQFFDKHTDELMQEAQKNIADTPWKFKIDEFALQLGGSLYVRHLIFDFKSNICEVTF